MTSPTACTQLRLIRAVAVGKEGPGDSGLARMADAVSPQSHVSTTHPWLQLTGTSPAPCRHGLSCAPQQPQGSAVGGVQGGLCPPGPRTRPIRGSQPLGGLQAWRAEGDTDKLSHCCQQSFQGNSFFPVSVPPWIHGLREALATEWCPACCSGWASLCRVCPRHSRTLKVTQLLAQPQGGHRKLHLDSPGTTMRQTLARTRGLWETPADCQQILKAPVSR